MTYKNKQQGFTLTELVVVITILAILGTVAAPKFISMLADARLSKMTGALGSMKSASAMAHAQFIARGFIATQSISKAAMQALPPSQQVVMEEIPVGFVNGYPAANQIAEISGITSPEYVILPVTGSSQMIAADDQHDGRGGNPACTAIYHEAEPGSVPTFTMNAKIEDCQ